MGKAIEFQVLTHEHIEMIDITDNIRDVVKASGIQDGFCTVFIPHTTAAVTINESNDAAVLEDYIGILKKLIPAKAKYKHLEGNSPSHIRASLMGFSERIIIEDGDLLLGVVQGIFLCEFDGPRMRKVFVKASTG